LIFTHGETAWEDALRAYEGIHGLVEKKGN